MSLPATILMGNTDHKISRQVLPEGGWKFQQGSVIIRGSNWDELVFFVRQHRKNNKMFEGDIEKEIEEQMLILQPGLRVRN